MISWATLDGRSANYVVGGWNSMKSTRMMSVRTVETVEETLMAKSKKMTAKVKSELVRRVGDEGEDFDLVITDLGITEELASLLLKAAGFEKCSICAEWSDCLNADGECDDCTSWSGLDSDDEDDDDLFKDPDEED
jgi:hypothetical protein